MTLFNRGDRSGDPAVRKTDQPPNNDPPPAATLTKLESAAPSPVESKPIEPPLPAAKPAST